MSNQKEEEKVRLNRLYGFSIVAGHPFETIHPIHQKHLAAVVEIRNIYRQVSAEAISSGKGEELVAAVIEHFSKKLTWKIEHGPACAVGYPCDECKKKRAAINDRSDKIKLLEAYSNFLEEHHYLDTDYRCEEPFAIDEFLKENK
jgi:hypothetical protein